MSDDDSRASTSSSSSSSSNQQTEKETSTPKKKESKISMSKNSKLLSTSAKRIQKELADITLDPPPNCRDQTDATLEPFPEETLQQKPNSNATRSLETVIQVQSQYWNSVRRFAPTVGYSFMEAERHDTEEGEAVAALASLSVMADKRRQDEPMEEDPMNQ